MRVPRRRPVARIAFNMRPLTRAWGGGNWWLTQMVRHLRSTGYAVGFDLKGSLDCIVVVDPRVGGNVTFGLNAIAVYREKNPGVRCLHRVNEGDMHRATETMDELLSGINAVADHTVFISEWLRDYHADRWFDSSRPHSVIHNGADPSIFHPVGSERMSRDGVMRLVTHHWSDNPSKGFGVYQQVDRLIAQGALPGTELWVIGRWPSGMDWRAALTFPPTFGRALADLLRRGHVYITASLWEAGAMHFVEGAQCGMPLLYHEDGGGIVEVGRRFGIGYRDDVAGAIAEMRERYDVLRGKVLEYAPSGDLMCARYRSVIQRLLV